MRDTPRPANALSVEERAALYDAIADGPRFREGIRDWLSCTLIAGVSYSEGIAKASHHPTARIAAAVVCIVITLYVVLRVRRPLKDWDALMRENKRLRRQLSDAAINAREVSALAHETIGKLQTISWPFGAPEETRER